MVMGDQERIVAALRSADHYRRFVNGVRLLCSFIVLFAVVAILGASGVGGPIVAIPALLTLLLGVVGFFSFASSAMPLNRVLRNANGGGHLETRLQGAVVGVVLRDAFRL